MQALEYHQSFITPLDSIQLRHMVTGSIAAIFYGEPRLTHDIDLVIVLSKSQVNRFIAVFPDEEYYCPPEEVIRVELSRDSGAHFNLIHHRSGLKADCYPFSGDELHEWAFEHTRHVDIGDGRVFHLAPPEYVIIRKLEYFRSGGSQKHLRDIRLMLEISGDWIDHEFVLRQIRAKNLEPIFAKLK